MCKKLMTSPQAIQGLKMAALVLVLSVFFVPDVFAFSQPIIKTMTNTENHLVLIGKGGAFLAFIYGVYTFFTGNPNWRIFIYALAGLAILFGWALFKSSLTQLVN